MRNVLGPSVKLAIFTLVTVLLTGALAATIANSASGRGSDYTALFTDASGVQSGDDVRMRGVKIGQITSLRVRDDALAEVGFQVDRARRLPAEVIAVIKYRNLIGQRYLALDAPPGAPGAVLPPGATIGTDHTRPALNLTDLLNGFHPLFQALSPADVNRLSGEIIQVFQGEGDTVDDLLASTASLTNTVADRDRAIGQVITNLNTVIGTVSARSPQLGNVIDTAQRLVSGLSASRQDITSAVGALAELTRTTAGLVDQARPPLHGDIDNVRRLAAMLNQHEPILNQQLRGWGPKLDRIMPVASYGSWFNYYACSVSGKISIEQLGITVPILPLPGNQLPARCRP
jgi:phospholipid/cholesterol/gamma-HCH transport system substrate-binding protein